MSEPSQDGEGTNGATKPRPMMQCVYLTEVASTPNLVDTSFDITGTLTVCKFLLRYHIWYTL